MPHPLPPTVRSLYLYELQNQHANQYFTGKKINTAVSLSLPQSTPPRCYEGWVTKAAVALAARSAHVRPSHAITIGHRFQSSLSSTRHSRDNFQTLCPSTSSTSCNPPLPFLILQRSFRRITMSRLFNPVTRLFGTPMLCLEALRLKGSLSKRGTEDELRVSARLPKATAFLQAGNPLPPSPPPFPFASQLTSGGSSSAVPVASPVCESFFNRERQPTNPTTPSQTRSSPGTGGVAGLRKQRCVNHSRVVDLLLARPASIRGCTGGRSTATTSARMLLANRTKPRRQMMNRNVRAVLQICERLPIRFVPSLLLSCHRMLPQSTSASQPCSRRRDV
jgi:hypothetical protein